MREIKFRCWDKSEKKMWFPDACGNGFSLKHDGITWRRDYVGDPIMQYTGLKDKKGKEIYEGDIMRGSHCEYINDIRHDDYPDKEPKGIVCFGDYVISTGIEGHGMRNGSELITGWFVKDKYGFVKHPKYLEVIGNIYENPELTKSDE